MPIFGIHPTHPMPQASGAPTGPELPSTPHVWLDWDGYTSGDIESSGTFSNVGMQIAAGSGTAGTVGQNGRKYFTNGTDSAGVRWNNKSGGFNPLYDNGIIFLVCSINNTLSSTGELVSWGGVGSGHAITVDADSGRAAIGLRSQAATNPSGSVSHAVSTAGNYIQILMLESIQKTNGGATQGSTLRLVELNTSGNTALDYDPGAVAWNVDKIGNVIGSIPLTANINTLGGSHLYEYLAWHVNDQDGYPLSTEDKQSVWDYLLDRYGFPTPTEPVIDSAIGHIDWNNAASVNAGSPSNEDIITAVVNTNAGVAGAMPVQRTVGNNNAAQWWTGGQGGNSYLRGIVTTATTMWGLTSESASTDSTIYSVIRRRDGQNADAYIVLTSELWPTMDIRNAGWVRWKDTGTTVGVTGVEITSGDMLELIAVIDGTNNTATITCRENQGAWNSPQVISSVNPATLRGTNYVAQGGSSQCYDTEYYQFAVWDRQLTTEEVDELKLYSESRYNS